jgi:hypothetical protein
MSDDNFFGKKMNPFPANVIMIRNGFKYRQYIAVSIFTCIPHVTERYSSLAAHTGTPAHLYIASLQQAHTLHK